MLLIENKAIANLPVAYQEFVRAKHTAPLKTISDYELEAQLKKIILVAAAELGLKDSIDSKVVTFIRETLMRDFRRSEFSLLTVELLQLFISKGIRGEYGSFRGQLNTLNVQNIIHWVRKGMASEEYKMAIGEFNRLVEIEAKTSNVPTAAEKMKQSKQAILMRFDEYRRTGNIGYVAYSAYNILCDLIGVDYNGVKTLVTDTEARKKVVAECTEAIQNKYAQQKEKAEKKKDLSLAASIGEYMVTLDKTEEYNNMVKDRFLKIFFDGLISEGKDLKL